MKRKRKGGAESQRKKKKKKALAADAASCCKIPAMFASKGTGRSRLHLHYIYNNLADEHFHPNHLDHHNR